MTREEAIEEYANNIYYGYERVFNKDIANALNNVYDDFESRTCENCKHQADSSLCSAGVLYDNYTDRDTFGCNKWESK